VNIQGIGLIDHERLLEPTEWTTDVHVTADTDTDTAILPWME
jgi:hypothetical protein